jgi:hypothetical protein
VAESLAGAITKAASTVVESIAIAKAFKQAGGLAGGVGASRFAVNQEQAQCAGPECGIWHVDFLDGSDGQPGGQGQPDQQAGDKGMEDQAAHKTIV